MHREGRGAKYTRGRGPLWLLGSWPQDDMPTSLRAERRFKALSRVQKEKWLEANLQPS
jgi:putative endonuclease